MFLMKKRLARRTVLKGMGVTMALPLLEAMVPARAARAQTSAGRVRFVCIEVPHDSAGSTAYGMKTERGLAGPKWSVERDRFSSTKHAADHLA